jgi:cytidylate kinase
VSRAVIVAIDGPAGSGKSTLAKRLAATTGLRFLDTGLLYRAVAARLRATGGSPGDAAAAAAAARTIEPEGLDPDALHGEGIGGDASQVAALPEVRAALLELQRRFARTPPGAVLAGRDIGTVVCPDATLKIFVTASIEERARRRFEELRARGEAPIHERVLLEVAERDRRDRERAVAPLSVAEDAVVIDTSTLDVEQSHAALEAAYAARIGSSANRTS